MDLRGKRTIPENNQWWSSQLVLEKVNKSGGVEGKWKIVDYHCSCTSTNKDGFSQMPESMKAVKNNISGKKGEGAWFAWTSRFVFPRRTQMVFKMDWLEGNLAYDVWNNKIGLKPSVVAGTISGKTAKFSPPVAGLNICVDMELTGPVMLGEGRTLKLSITKPSQGVKVPCNRSNPNELSIEAHAVAYPPEYADRIVWNAENIKKASINISPSANGDHVIIVYKGLPAVNKIGNLGPYRIGAKLTLEECHVETSTRVYVSYDSCCVASYDLQEERALKEAFGDKRLIEEANKVPEDERVKKYKELVINKVFGPGEKKQGKDYEESMTTDIQRECKIYCGKEAIDGIDVENPEGKQARIRKEWEKRGYPHYLFDAHLTHEKVHQKNCDRYYKGEIKDYAGRTPESLSKDEVAAYDASIKYIEGWLKKNCK